MSNTTSETLRLAGTANDSITDGPGLRFTIFLQGCVRNCPHCHNPKAQPLEGGTHYSPEALMRTIGQNPLLSGVTFSGGEPLLQAGALVPLAKMIKLRGLSIVLYTGYTFEEILRVSDKDVLALLSLCDTLVDGPYLHEERALTLLFRGSKNQRVLNLPASLRARRAVEEASEGWGSALLQ